jgi:uncharacterized protein YcbK (DUF882 family)
MGTADPVSITLTQLKGPLGSSRRRRLLGCACCSAAGFLVPAWARAAGENASSGLTERAGEAAPADDRRASTTVLAATTGRIQDWRARLLQGARSLWLVRGEAQVRSTYWTPESGYDGEAYKEICWLLRDVQANKTFAMSPRLLDVLCGLQNWLAFNGVRQPILVNSGYRTFATNWNTEGSALNSRHVLGKAVDITVPGVTLARLAGMASVFGQGGVGMYLNKGFVHVDTGEERVWIK